MGREGGQIYLNIIGYGQTASDKMHIWLHAQNTYKLQSAWRYSEPIVFNLDKNVTIENFLQQS